MLKFLSQGEISALKKNLHAAILKTDNQQGPPVERMELCSTLCGRLDGRGVRRRMDTCMCMAESLHCSPETITTLLIGYTPIQNKFFLFFKLPSLVSKNGNEP